MEQYLNFIISLIVSLVTAAYFIRKQRGFYRTTMRNLDQFQKFFQKTDKYKTIDVDPDNAGSTSKRLVNVADSSVELYSLIEDINEYLKSCKGTATFNIIQNKTERRIAKLYDKTTSKSSFPTHYGLMGTFVGVFLGLGAFLGMSLGSSEGITDDAIHSLILGVLVSMSTSFIGLRMSTKANDLISDAKNKIDDDKNEFYEFVQNRLMPSVDISLTEALGNLHQTVSDFEPSFSKVITGFKETFNQCTLAFGEDFRKSVKSMVSAVDKMSTNINKITENVDILEELLDRLSGAEWMQYMRQFAEASGHFKELTQSLNDFERARRMLLAATQEAINLQKSYNDSLTIPREVASEINTILQRVVKFEQNINALGADLAATQMLGNTTIEEIKNQISAIKVKHKVAEQYIETSNNKLEMFFDSQLIELKRLEKKYLEALDTLFKAYETITSQHESEINQRHGIFKKAIEDKFELSGVRSELAHLSLIPSIEAGVEEVKSESNGMRKELKKVESIESKVDEVKRGQEKLQRTNEGIRSELNAFNAAKEEEKKGAVGRLLSGSNTAKDREIEKQKKENEALQKIIEQAQKEREEEARIKSLLAEREGKRQSPTNDKEDVRQDSPISEEQEVKPEEPIGTPKPSFLKRIFGRRK